MCLTSRSKVLRWAPLLLGRIVRFQLRSKKMALRSLKPPFPIGVLGNKRFSSWREGPTLKPSSSAQNKAEILLPWLTKLCFETGIFEHVWPPLQYNSNICAQTLKKDNYNCSDHIPLEHVGLSGDKLSRQRNASTGWKHSLKIREFGESSPPQRVFIQEIHLIRLYLFIYLNFLRQKAKSANAK